jgi:hypothetical protein
MAGTSARLAALLVPAVALSGCATALRGVWPDEAPARTVEVACRPVAAGLRIAVDLPDPPAAPGRPDLKDWLGGGLDVVVGFNLPLLLLPFSDMGSAYLAAGALAAAAVGADYVLGATLGAARPGRSRGAWQAQVSYPAALAPVSVTLAETGAPAGGAGLALAGVAALDPRWRTQPLTVAVRDPEGHLLRQEVMQFPADAWGPAEQAVVAEVRPEPPVDVDQLPASARAPDPRAVAIVIGLERYNSRIPGVTYAERDAAVVREYFIRVLGVKPENLLYLTNDQATKGAIETAFEAQLPALVVPGRSDVYVYYAGHGAPDLESKIPYLIPYDGHPDFPKKSCYSLDSMYAALGKLEARSVTVALDACFSGTASRTDGAAALLANARPLFVAPVASYLPPGVAVLAAASAEQVSSGLPPQRHGLFTYYLLKGLGGEAFVDGRLTLGALHSYLAREVPGQARKQGRTQTPLLLGGAADRVLVAR